MSQYGRNPSDPSPRAKYAGSSTYPVKAIGGGSFKRIEPLLTPELFIQRFMWGIPLTSPLTKQQMTQEQIQDWIQMAMNQAELELKIDIAPVKRRHRLAFARDLYEEYLYLEIPNKPILSIDSLSITSADNVLIYRFPPEWIDNANFVDGRINVVPMSPATYSPGTLAGNQSLPAGAGGGFLVLLGINNSVPAYWEVDCTTGFNNKTGIPYIINQMIGLLAAIRIFNNLIPQFQLSSFSLGIDNVNQSQTNQAPLLYAQIRDKYKEEYEELKSQILTMYNNNIIVGML